MIGPWRASPVPLAAGAQDALEGKVFPSGRQALTQLLRMRGLTRKDRVAVPEWSSACVLSAVSVCATPLLLSDVRASDRPPAAVLLYDQWGWSRPSRLEKIRRRWPDAFLIHDTVDTADLSPEIIQALKSGASTSRTRLWSLSKVLGLMSGGLGCFEGGLADFRPEPSHLPLREALEGSPPMPAAAIEMGKSYIQCLPLALERTVKSSDLFAGYAGERLRRLSNLDAVRGTSLSEDWPNWMADGGADGGPGLCPILRGRPAALLEALQGRIRDELQLTLPVYHFDYSTDPFEPAFERCLALPVHGEVSADTIGDVERLVSQFEERHASSLGVGIQHNVS